MFGPQKSFRLVHDSNQQILDFQQLLGHLVVLTHVDLLLTGQFIHDQLHLALQFSHLLDLLLLHLDVAVDYSKQIRTFCQDFLFALEQGAVVLEDLGCFFCLLGVLLDALQQFLVLEGVFDELVLVELLLHRLDLLVAGVEDLLEFADFLGVFLLCVDRGLLISVAYWPIKALPSVI